MKKNQLLRMNRIILSLFIFLVSLSVAHAQNYTINTVGGNGTPGFLGDGGQATNAEINSPYGVYIDASENIFIPDNQNNRTRIINSGGVINTFAGNGIAGFSGDGGQATAAEMSNPYGVTGDGAGNIYVTANSRVRKIAPNGIITTIAGTGVAGYSGDGGQASNAELNVPAGLAFDHSGNLYIADLIAQCVRKINTNGIITTIAGTGVSGYNGDNIAATAAEISNPNSVAIDPSGNVFISDQFNNRIREVNTNGIISTYAGTGVASYTGDGAQATAATINRPFYVSLDAAGNLYISDFANNAIRKISNTGIISTIAGTGVGSFSGDGGPATAATLHGPTGISLDPSDNLFITDQSNARVRALDIICGLGASMGVPSVILCNGGTSHVSVAPQFGAGPYVFSWNSAPVQHTATATLTAGTYIATITDNQGCTATASVTITQPAAINIGMASTPTSCGGNTGTVTATPSGGTGAYTYAWAPIGTTSATATGLSTGTYSVTVNDANGCAATASVAVTNPGITVTTNNIINEPCNGSAAGAATANPAGGTAPYTYAWATSGGVGITASGLTAGTYTVTLTDNNGCVATATATITEPLGLNINMAGTQATCGSSNGTATATPSGGTGAYTYMWSPIGTTGATATGLSAGTYTVSVNDANGCTSTASVQVTNPGNLAVNTNVTNVACNGSATGSSTANPSGGTAPYTYVWAPSGGTGITASGLSAGTYTVTLTDNGGCITTASATITQPAALSIAQGSLPASSGSNCDGTAWVTVSGGTSAYTYAWNPGGAITDTIKNVCNGNFCCIVTDHNGCKDSTCVDVGVTGIPVIGTSSSIKIFPSPNNGMFTISGLSKGILVEIYDYTGQKINNTISDNDIMQVNIADKANGIYLIRITSNDGKLLQQSKFIKTN